MHSVLRKETKTDQQSSMKQGGPVGAMEGAVEGEDVGPETVGDGVAPVTVGAGVAPVTVGAGVAPVTVGAAVGAGVIPSCSLSQVW